MTYSRPLTGRPWAQARVADLPPRWQLKMLAKWEADRAGADWWEQQHNEVGANKRLRRVAESLKACRIPLDSKDGDVCAIAEKLAEQNFESATRYHAVDVLRHHLNNVCKRWEIEPPHAKRIEDRPAVARMCDPIWLRRKLRAVHRQHLEAAAIELGLVNRARDPYVSNENVTRRAEQNERNAAMMADTIARNELGQEYTLAELAAKGPANKAIRRAELMTRISGFERIALDMGHVGLFMTITCPSRMHKWATVMGGGVVENKRYDGTLPNEAQKHLAKTWAQIRAKLKRDSLGIYGFRIAEPNHDGTPHWHMLLFVEPSRLENLRSIIWKYALKDSPNEPGASRHRVDFKPIDAGRGSAAGYIAKYVAKNIDGYKLDKDLIGNDAIETSQRVETWAATWGIRQFQQIGGAPVGVWRELRRVKDLPSNAPEHLRKAHAAVNRVADLETGEVKAVAWDHYTTAQGGVFCGRKHLIKLAKETPEGQNRYGEEKAPKPYGVETWAREYWTPAHMAHMPGNKHATRVIEWTVESDRHEWEIVRSEKGSSKGQREALAPWTCVNNCTDGVNANTERNTAGQPEGHGIGNRGMGQSPNPSPDDGGPVCGATFGRLESAGSGTAPDFH